MPSIPTSMRVIDIAEFGGPDVLRLAERPVPAPRAGEVLIRVTAAGVNRPDIMQRLGKYPPPPGASDIPGLEVSGEIVGGMEAAIGRHVCALVSGGTSGIGTTAIQLARARGAMVLTTAGSDEKVAACLALGAVRAINYHREDFVAAVKDATGGEGVDVVLDIVGGDYLQRNLECLRMNGRLAQIGLIAGSKSPFDLRP